MSPETADVLLAIEDVPTGNRFDAWLAPLFDVRTATTVDEAIDVLEAGWAGDVLVLSRLLPDYGADAVLREVRRRDHRCRVVMVDDGSGIERIHAGVDARIARPVAATDLRGVVGTPSNPDPIEDRYDSSATGKRRGEAL